MFDGTEDWCKIWSKTYLYFQKGHEEFAKFSQAINGDFIMYRNREKSKSKLKTTRWT